MNVGTEYIKLGTSVRDLRDFSKFFVSILPNNELEYNDTPQTTLDGTTINTTQNAFYRPTLSFELSYNAPIDYKELRRVILGRNFVAEYNDPDLGGKKVIRLMHLSSSEKQRMEIWGGRYRGIIGIRITATSSLGYRTTDEQGNIIDTQFLDSVDGFDADGNRVSHDMRIR